MNVTARAQRSGEWWAIEVPEVEGVFTQAKRLDQVQAMVADAVATMLEIDPAEVEVDLQPVFSAPVAESVTSVLSLSHEAERARRQATQATRALVRTLRHDQELSIRDVGTVLGLSHQRVAQIEKENISS